MSDIWKEMNDDKWFTPSFKDFSPKDKIKLYNRSDKNAFIDIPLWKIYLLPRMDDTPSFDDFIDDLNADEMSDSELRNHFSLQPKFWSVESFLFWEFYGFYLQLKYINFENPITPKFISDDQFYKEWRLDVPFMLNKETGTPALNPYWGVVIQNLFNYHQDHRNHELFEDIFMKLGKRSHEKYNFFADKKIGGPENIIFLTNVYDVWFDCDRVKYLLHEMCRGGSVDRIFNEKESMESLMKKVPSKITQHFNKNVLNDAKKLLDITKKIEKKVCKDALEQLGQGECQNPNNNKRFKNCCMKRVVHSVVEKDIQSKQREMEQEILTSTTESDKGLNPLRLSIENKLKPQKFEPPTKYHKDILKEFLDIGYEHDGYTIVRNLQKDQFVEKYSMFNDYYYKCLEHLGDHSSEWVDMLGKFYFGVFVNYYFKRMSFINNTREIGSKSSGVAYQGEGTFKIEKVLRIVKSDSEMNNGFEYDLESRNFCVGDWFYTIHKGSRLDKVNDKKLKLYRGIQRKRQWIGNSWTFDQEDTNFFIYIHGLRSSSYVDHVDKDNFEDVSVMKGYLCEIEVDTELFMRYEIRGAFKEKEVILCKGDLDKTKLRMWEVEVHKALQGRGSMKKIREVPASEIPNNKLFGTDDYPKYLFD